MDDSYNLINALTALHRVNAHQTFYWNIFATVVLAILAFVGSNYAKGQPRKFYIYLIFGYIFFSLANALEIFLSQRNINTISRSIESYVNKNSSTIDQSFLPIFEGKIYIDSFVVLSFHLLIDLIIVLILLRSYKNTIQ